MNSRVRQRQRWDFLMTVVSYAMTGMVIFTLGAILWSLLWNGIGAIGPAIFTESTPAPGNQGGLANAIMGSLLMTVIAVLIATPIGILVGHLSC